MNLWMVSEWGGCKTLHKVERGPGTMEGRVSPCNVAISSTRANCKPILGDDANDTDYCRRVVSCIGQNVSAVDVLTVALTLPNESIRHIRKRCIVLDIVDDGADIVHLREVRCGQVVNQA